MQDQDRNPHELAAFYHRQAADAIVAHLNEGTDETEEAAEEAINDALVATEELRDATAQAAANEAGDAWHNEDLDRAIDEHENAAKAHDEAAKA